MTYRKKPVEIEAVQFEDTPERIEEIAAFVGRDLRVNYGDKNNPYIPIETLEGTMKANVGDYIIRGIKGEYYPCKPDVFEATYDRVDYKCELTSAEEVNAFIENLTVREQISDGYHTFEELYDFRRAYNAALVNTHKYPCIKSHRHSDGELCFGGGWFIVQIQLPTGQISNHYEDKYWDEFDCEERERADEWDGHTDKDVLDRLTQLNLTRP